MWISEEVIEEVRRLEIRFLYHLPQYYVTGADINDEKGEHQDKRGCADGRIPDVY